MAANEERLRTAVKFSSLFSNVSSLLKLIAILVQAFNMKTKYTTTDVCAAVHDLRQLVGMRVLNVYDIDSKTYLLKLHKCVIFNNFLTKRDACIFADQQRKLLYYSSREFAFTLRSMIGQNHKRRPASR